MTARKIARHIITMIVILVALTALAIWLDLGPAVRSRAVRSQVRQARVAAYLLSIQLLMNSSDSGRSTR